MSLVMGKTAGSFLQPIFSAALNGMEDYDATVKNRTPVYFVVGEDDEYYGSEPSREAYQKTA